MEWKVEYLESEDVMKATQGGSFSMAEQIQFLDGIVGHPQWLPGMGLLIAYDELIVDNVRTTEVSEIAVMFARLQQNLSGSRIALACKSDVQFGQGRQFEMILAARFSGEVAVFRDEMSAFEWLSTTYAVS